jgi:hypothetical protein
MPLQKLQLRPGVNRESTSLANEGTWFEMDKVRFRSGYPEKLGGWTLDTGSAESTLQPPAGSFWGVCRALWNWITLDGFNLMGLGTNLKYYVQQTAGGTFYDVTPLRDTASGVTNAFTVTDGSYVVTVTDAGHGAQTGDFVTITYAGGAIGGMAASSINGEHQITYISASQYSFVSTSVATSNAGPTGTADFAYQITVGSEIFTVGVGWGAGGWGGTTTIAASTTLDGALSNSATTITVVSTTGFAASGAIGIGGEYITYAGKTSTTFTGCTRGVGSTARAYATGTTVNQFSGATGWGIAAPEGLGVGIQMRLWSQANYGQDLIINPRGGALYLWKVNANPNIYDRAVLLSSTSPSPYTTDTSCPSVCNAVSVSDASRFVIAFGCNDYGATEIDPLLVRWSDQEDYSVWAPAATNQAGSYRLSTGSGIVANLQTRQEILVWTDAAIYSMQYLGPPFVWGFQIMGANISIAGPNTVATAANITYWMGLDKFYMYSGRVETLYCPLRQYIFGDINLQQQYQFFASTNEGYNEIWWFYCSANSTVIDRYVVYNHLEKIWSYGNMSRTAWLDSPLRDFPVAAGYNGQLIYHEDGVNDGTTNPPSPITAYIQSADFNIGDGHNYGFVWRMIPDITFDGSSVNMPAVTITMRPRQNPGANYGAAPSPEVKSTQNYQGQRNYVVQEFTQIVYTRVRGRQMAFRISSDGLGVQWQLGVPSIDVRPDGRR